MEFIPHLNKIQKHQQNLVVTIGNFDGVHLGHQHLLQTLKQRAENHTTGSMVVTFEPLPLEYLQQEKALTRLTSLREKITHFRHLQIDHLLRLKFNRDLANLSAETFVEDILVKQLKIAHLLVGEDFRFGKNREGDIYFLEKKAKQHQFIFEAIKKIHQENDCISSTRTRSALQQSDFFLAQQLLGRPYSISGRVISGKKLARTLGFPTANIPLTRLNPPISGVFAVQAWGLGNEPLCGVANIGKRPTVSGTKNMLEVHLFDFDQNIYQKQIKVVPLKKIREEKKFPDIQALSQQIAEDVIVAKCFFNNSSSI